MKTESKVTEIFCIADDFDFPIQPLLEVMTRCFIALTKGESINFVLTKANVDDRNENDIDTLTDNASGNYMLTTGISPSRFPENSLMMGYIS